MNIPNNSSFNWYQKSYKNKGIDAQRRYPNQDLGIFLDTVYNKTTSDYADVLQTLSLYRRHH